jgi:hypothetical protein
VPSHLDHGRHAGHAHLPQHNFVALLIFALHANCPVLQWLDAILGVLRGFNVHVSPHITLHVSLHFTVHVRCGAVAAGRRCFPG